MTTAVEITGIAATIRRLNDLGKKGAKRAVTKAVRAGGREQLLALRRNAPIDTGALRRYLTQRVSTKKGVTLSRSGAKNLKGAKRNPIHYLHLVERGTRPHTIYAPSGGMSIGGTLIMRKVQHPGSRANDFVARSYRESASRALAAHNKKLEVEIEAEVRKLRGVG